MSMMVRWLSTHYSKWPVLPKKSYITLIAICRTYLDPNAKKKVLLSDRMTKSEKDRPSTPFLTEVQQSLEPHLEEHFQAFLEVPY